MFSSNMDEDHWGSGVAARYPGGLVSQGISAELIAARWKLDRGVLDEFSARSHERAANATRAGLFSREIVPVTTQDTHGADVLHSLDETIRPDTTVEGLGKLRPSFVDDPDGARFPEIDWRITAGNSSPLTDGASAALIMEAEVAASLGLKPRARFHAFSVTGDDPVLMLMGVVPATKLVLSRANLDLDDIDAYEVNEAFAPVPLAWAKAFDADLDRLNPRGGAIALGHPLGSSGLRLMATLVNQLEESGGRFGLQTMCEGGGMANATILESL
jgi:acetyl-CoA acyltransferase